MSNTQTAEIRDREIEYELKEGDTLPVISETLTDEEGEPLDVSDAGTEVRFRMGHVDSDTLILDSVATIVDAPGGKVEYQFGDGETDRSGLHIAEWVITYSDGDVRTIPNEANIGIMIEEGVLRGTTPAELSAGVYSMEKLTVTGELTDAAGVTHTGELADEGTPQPPQDHDNAAHLTDYAAVGHNHTGDTLNPNTVNATNATVSSAPSNESDVVNKEYADSVGIGGGDVNDYLDINQWNWVDAGNHGFVGNRNDGDLSSLIEQNPNATIILQPGGEYEMSNLDLNNYNYLGLVCFGFPRAQIYPANPGATMTEYLDLGDHGGTAHGGQTWMKNLEFVNEAGRTDANGNRYDVGLMKAQFHENALFQNIKFSGARHRIEDNGDGTQTTHGSRYQIRAEGATPEANVVFDGLYMPDGGTEEAVNGVATGHSIGFAVEEHYGTLEIKNSYLEGFVDNGLYTTWTIGNPDDGRVTVRNTYVGECKNSNIRTGPNHVIENCTITLTDQANETYQGIALHVQDPDNTDIDGLRIVTTNHSNDGIRINSAHGHAHLKNVWYTNLPGTGDGSINMVEALGTPDDPEGSVTFENCTFEDEGDDNSKPAPINIGRDDITFRDCVITTTQSHGVWDKGGITMEGCTVSVPNGKYNIRIGDYSDSSDPSPTEPVRLVGNDFEGGDGIQAESHVRSEGLVVKENDLRTTDGYANLDGEYGTFVWKNNPGANMGAHPDTVRVRNRPDTDAGVPILDRPMPFASTFPGDTHVMTNSESDSTPRQVYNDGNTWRYTNNTQTASNVLSGNEGAISGIFSTDAGNTSTDAAAAYSGGSGYLIDGATNTSGLTQSMPGDSLWYWPRKGDKFRFYLRTTTNDTSWVFHFAQQTAGSAADGYSMYFNWTTNNTDDFSFSERSSSGDNQLINTAALGWTANQWYEVTVEWRDDGSGEIYIEVEDLSTSTNLVGHTAQTTFDYVDGGFGWYVSGTDTVHFDEFDILP